jgi:hypothetical protein
LHNLSSSSKVAKKVAGDLSVSYFVKDERVGTGLAFCYSSKLLLTAALAISLSSSGSRVTFSAYASAWAYFLAKSNL